MSLGTQSDGMTMQTSTTTNPSSTPTDEEKNTTSALIAFVAIVAVIALVIMILVTIVILSTVLKGKRRKPLQSINSDDDTDTPYNRGIYACTHHIGVI